MTVALFDDQTEFVDGLRAAIAKGNKSILGVASPAFGKTVIAAHIIKAARSKSPAASAWFLVHRKNLLRQTSQSFWQKGIEHGLLTSGRVRSLVPVQVGTIGTVYSRLANLRPPSIMFVDEAHLARGNMFETVIKWALSHGSRVIGLTGTPERLDGKPLGELFEVMVLAKSTALLIENGRLSDYEIYRGSVVADLSAVGRSAGDYNREQLAGVMDNRVIIGDVISHWRKYANGMRTVCYCVNVKHSKHTAEQFNAAGIPAVHVDADTTDGELKEACEGIASGRYLVLCNCELVIEGFDLSAQVGRDVTLECCILLRPTQSVARYLQMVFRAMRRKPRPAIVLDHAGCSWLHGFPDDDREWSLDGRTRRKSGAADEEVKVRQCPACFYVYKPSLHECPKCGAGPAKSAVREIQHIDGDLVRVDKEAERKQRRQEQGSARTLADLVALGIRRGMKKPAEWAAMTVAARHGKRPTSADFKQARDAYEEIMANEQRDSANALHDVGAF